MNIVDDITLLTAAFNRHDITLYMLKSFNKMMQRAIPAMILDNSTTMPLGIQSTPVLTIINNCNFTHTPNYGQASPNHCSSLEYAMQLIKTRYVLLCDNDILFKPAIKSLLATPVGSFHACGEIGWDIVPPNRLFPYMCIIDLAKKRNDNISYFDWNRICLPNRNSNDTGASFLQDIQAKHWSIKPIALNDYCVHMKGVSLHQKDTNEWYKMYTHLYN